MKKSKTGNTGYFIKEGIGNIFTNGFMSFASVCVIVACLIIMGSFALLALNVDALIHTFEDENVILAFVDEGLTEEQTLGLQSQLEAIDNVSYVQYISKEDAMESFVGKYQDSSLFDGLDASVFRDRYAVYLDDISLAEQTQTDLRNVDGIAEVNANLDIARGFVTVRNIVSGVSLVIGAILFIVSIFIMSNTIKLATFERREEIAIMRMVGATNSFIRWPFVFEGFFLGIFGALVAYVAQWGIYQVVVNKVVGSYTVNYLSILPFSDVAVVLLAIFLTVGFLVGVVGSLMTIKNYLKV